MRLHPIPGTQLLKDADVTPAMRDYAVALLHDQAVPLNSTLLPLVIDGVTLLARVETHPAEPSIPHQHRGVTLFRVVGDVMAEGIDISGFQPRIDWQHVRRSASFVFAKASEGVHLKDNTFDDHWAEAASVDLLKGAYHFFRPALDAQAQADNFLAAVRDKLLDLPPVLDVEVDGGVSPQAVASGVATWLRVVRGALRMQPMVYTMPAFWNARVAPSAGLGADLWVAHWDVAAPTVPRDFRKYQFWQYASDMGVPGVGPKMDVCRFAGTYAELLTYANDLARS